MGRNRGLPKGGKSKKYMSKSDMQGLGAVGGVALGGAALMGSAAAGITSIGGLLSRIKGPEKAPRENWPQAHKPNTTPARPKAWPKMRKAKSGRLNIDMITPKAMKVPKYLKRPAKAGYKTLPNVKHPQIKNFKTPKSWKNPYGATF